MSNLSYCPHYYQGIIWVAELQDGTLLREWSNEGKETLFRDIPQNKLKKFHFIGENIDYWFDCQTGNFVVDGKTFVFPLTGQDLKFGEGLIHFKGGEQEFIANKMYPYQGFNISGYSMGWKVTQENLKVQVLFSLPRKEFDIEVTFLDLQKTVSWKVKV